MQQWVFVHNDPDGLASETLVNTLGQLATDHPFGSAPTSTQVNQLQMKETIPVIRYIEGRDVSSSVSMNPPNPRKVEYNALNDNVREMLKNGRRKEKLVRQYIEKVRNPTFLEGWWRVEVVASNHSMPAVREKSFCIPTSCTLVVQMSLLGNVVWFLCGGFLVSLGYFIGGLGFCLTIVGIPFGFQSMKLGVANLAPFGKDIVESPDANSVLRVVFNLLWLVFFGWEIALCHLFWALFLAITIIGLPFAKQHVKLIPLALLPLGRSLEKTSG